MLLCLLSPFQNICPSNVSVASFPPHEVACHAWDGQVCAGPGPSVIKRPSCAVTSDIEAGVIHDPVPAPSEGHAQTLTGLLRLGATRGISMKDDRAVFPSAPRWAPPLHAWSSLLPKCRMGPHQLSVNNRRSTPTPCPECLLKRGQK